MFRMAGNSGDLLFDQRSQEPSSYPVEIARLGTLV